MVEMRSNVAKRWQSLLQSTLEVKCRQQSDCHCNEIWMKPCRKQEIRGEYARYKSSSTGQNSWSSQPQQRTLRKSKTSQHGRACSTKTKLTLSRRCSMNISSMVRWGDYPRFLFSRWWFEDICKTDLMPTNLTPPPKDDEVECGNCGAYTQNFTTCKVISGDHLSLRFWLKLFRGVGKPDHGNQSQ